MTADFKGRKRPRDPNQLAKLIVDIPSGAVEDRDPTPGEIGGRVAGWSRLLLTYVRADAAQKA
jgi:hypothetical protein